MDDKKFADIVNLFTTIHYENMLIYQTILIKSGLPKEEIQNKIDECNGKYRKQVYEIAESLK